MMQEEIAKAGTKTFYPSEEVIGPYSPAVKAGPLLFVSGQTGIDPETGKFAGDDIENQTRQSLDNLMGVLSRAGYDSSDVIQCTVFLRDMGDFQRMNLIYGGYFADSAFPARSTVAVGNLPLNARIEIAAIAVKSR
jgi:2-iminobutanoate/2-iminopropanoate deaminase